MLPPPNPYAPPAADLGIEPRASSNLARYIIGICFLLMALRDGLRFVSFSLVSEAIQFGFDPIFLTLSVVLLVLRFTAALAFLLRWRFGWWLGMALVGYSIGAMVPAMRGSGALFAATASAPLLLILIPHFTASVRSTFRVDRRGLLAGMGVLVACMIARAAYSLAPY